MQTVAERKRPQIYCNRFTVRQKRKYTGALGRKAAAQGHVTAENQSQMGRHRGIDFDDIVALAKAVDDLVNPYNPKEERQRKKKYVPKGDSKKQKKKQHQMNKAATA